MLPLQHELQVGLGQVLEHAVRKYGIEAHIAKRQESGVTANISRTYVERTRHPPGGHQCAKRGIQADYFKTAFRSGKRPPTPTATKIEQLAFPIEGKGRNWIVVQLSKQVLISDSVGGRNEIRNDGIDRTRASPSKIENTDLFLFAYPHALEKQLRRALIDESAPGAIQRGARKPDSLLDVIPQKDGKAYHHRIEDACRRHKSCPNLR